MVIKEGTLVVMGVLCLDCGGGRTNLPETQRNPGLMSRVDVSEHLLYG